MADYWKSQPRKFCQYCKCWIADNKPSIEFHERGKNHKENVAAKISEIKKKSVQKAKQDEKMCKQFAVMEEAAMKAYEEDLKRMGREAAFGPETETTSTTSTYQPVPTVKPAKQPQSTREESQQKKPQKKVPQPKAPAPTQHPPHPPHPLHLPHLPHPPHPLHPQYPQHPSHLQHSGAALWVEGKSNEGYTYYYNTVTGESRWEEPKASAAGSTLPSAESVWMEALSPEGYTYYYNTVTGESSWEKPADYTPKEASGSSQQGDGQEEPSNIEEASNTEEAKETEEEGAPSEQSSTQAGATDQGPPSTTTEIQPRKRKAEAGTSEDTPEEAEGEKDQEERGTSAAENKQEEKQDEAPTGRFRPPNPYGTWERIKVDKDPYANVDWQLPQVQGGEDTAVELPPEPKHKFKTRVITSLGDSSTGPVTFKKKKSQNGKSRSLRQRDEDD